MKLELSLYELGELSKVGLAANRITDLECDLSQAKREVAVLQAKVATINLRDLRYLIESANAGAFIATIKGVRCLTNCGLKEAKDLVDSCNFKKLQQG